MKAYIYSLEDPRTGHIRYVGKTNNPYRRNYAHLNDRNKSKKTSWIIALKKLGLTPVMDILEEVEDSDWASAEIFWISYLRFLGFNLTNLCNGGVGPSGATVSNERRKFLSEKMKGKPMPEKCRDGLMSYFKSERYKQFIKSKKGKPVHPNSLKALIEKGSKTPTEKSRIACMNAITGIKLPDWHKKKISESLRGRKFSEEWKMKISLAKKGVRPSQSCIDAAQDALRKKRELIKSLPPEQKAEYKEATRKLERMWHTAKSLTGAGQGELKIAK